VIVTVAPAHDRTGCVSNFANDGAGGFALRQRFRRKKTSHAQHKESKVSCPRHDFPTHSV